MNNTKEKNSLAQFVLEKFPGTYSYIDYRSYIDNLLLDGKVTGLEQSEHLIEYTKLNIHRMNRWDKHTLIIPEIKTKMESLRENYHWLVITEGWCGDSAQILPVLHQISMLNPGINFRIASRDENPWLMGQFLSDGKRSIPILVCMDEKGHEMFRWGSRPKPAIQLMNDLKLSTEPVYSIEKIKEQLHLWYARDKAIAIQTEMLSLLESLK